MGGKEGGKGRGREGKREGKVSLNGKEDSSLYVETYKNVPFRHKPSQHCVVCRVEQNEKDQVCLARHPALWRWRRRRAGRVNMERGGGCSGVQGRHRHGHHGLFVFVGGGNIGVLVHGEGAIAGFEAAAGRSRGIMLGRRRRSHAGCRNQGAAARSTPWRLSWWRRRFYCLCQWCDVGLRTWVRWL